jgi:transcriptional regulator
MITFSYRQEVFMDYRNIFAERLLSLRKQANISQRTLAKDLNLTNPAVTMMEKAKRSPSFEVLLALADYFNVSLDYLCGRSDNPDRQ